MAADPLAKEPPIIRRASKWDPTPQAAILFEALMAERRNTEHFRLKYEAARESLERRARNDQERPYISKARRYTWRTEDGTAVPGIALMAGPRVLAHLTEEESIKLSNRLIDLAENLEEGDTE